MLLTALKLAIAALRIAPVCPDGRCVLSNTHAGPSEIVYGSAASPVTSMAKCGHSCVEAAWPVEKRQICDRAKVYW